MFSVYKPTGKICQTFKLYVWLQTWVYFPLYYFR